MKRSKKIVIAIAVVAFWLGIWQLISMAVAQELLVPAPLAVCQALAVKISTSLFWETIFRSMLRVALGFVWAVVSGVILAVITTRVNWVRVLLAPLLQCIKAVPVASFIILALVWLPRDTLPVYICFLMVLPIVWSNVERGIRETDAKLLEMAKVYRFGVWRTLLTVQVPSVMPYLMSALTTGLGFAWKSGIAAEVICQPALSIGKQLHTGRMYLETADVFAWTLTVVILSVILEFLLKKLIGVLGARWGFAERKEVGKA